MPRFFGKYPGGASNLDGKGSPVLTAEEAYQEGFKTGRNWDKIKCPWVPGGPHTTSARDHERNDAKTNPDKKDWVAYCDATLENHTMWMAGFHEGFASQ